MFGVQTIASKLLLFLKRETNLGSKTLSPMKVLPLAEGRKKNPMATYFCAALSTYIMHQMNFLVNYAPPFSI